MSSQPTPALENKLANLCQALKLYENLGSQGITLPQGVLLYGPSAASKAKIAQEIARDCTFAFRAFKATDLRSNFIGQSSQNVHRMFEQARSASPCILFVDEMDAVTPARGSGEADAFSNEILNQWLTEQNFLRQKTVPFVFVVAATDNLANVDPAVQARLDRIEVQASTANG